MRVNVIAIGQRQPAWVEAAVADYLDRFPRDFPVRLKVLRARPRRSGTERLLAQEADDIRRALPGAGLVIALDERGADLSTVDLARRLADWRQREPEVSFLIGGPDGLDEGLKREAHHLLRLSSLTLPHALARVLLLEQLYRAWSIISHHPYHRA